MEQGRIGDWELETIISDLQEWYGYDFSNYSRASLKRRVNRLWSIDRFPSLAELRFRLRSDQQYLRRFVEEITVNVTEMFRDPAFYLALRRSVLPVLATYPFIRIWHAGCSTGEEVYSMAIMLQEEKLLHKSLLYATDLNPSVLEKARKGIFGLAQMKTYTENYIAAGGKTEFSTYYAAKYGHAKFDESLREKMVFSTHNLVSDSSFNAFQLILCRNVLIYFDKQLQDRVLQLFDESLDHFGFLGLGSKETLRFSGVMEKYSQLGNEKIWRRKS